MAGLGQVGHAGAACLGSPRRTDVLVGEPVARPWRVRGQHVLDLAGKTLKPPLTIMSFLRSTIT
ncbi:hypothetical protein BCD49_28435 [Pseudofrankia sp. EUN1h]|nr:hypothetical protein BCD49_28435 [Pseudofrankia sp. EUN1h]